MAPVPALLGVPVALLAGIVVYADAAGRDMTPGVRLGWSAGVAVASLTGFLAAFGLDGVFLRGYVVLADGPVVVTHPRQLVASLFVVGLAVTAGSVLAYGVGTRWGPLATA